MYDSRNHGRNLPWRFRSIIEGRVSIAYTMFISQSDCAKNNALLETVSTVSSEKVKHWTFRIDCTLCMCTGAGVVLLPVRG